MESVVISVGGSILLGPEGPDAKRTRAFGEALEEAARKVRLFAVVGGGSVARRYIQPARELGLDEASLDDLGIAVTRINARVLIAAMPSASPVVAHTIDQALLASKDHAIVALGGTHAGHTTDAVAAMMAEKARARLVIATNVDGVFDKDPNRAKDAKLLPEMTTAELVELTIRGQQAAGSTGVVDPLAAKIIHRSGIETAVVNGTKVEAVRSALLGKPFTGTRIAPKGARA